MGLSENVQSQSYLQTNYDDFLKDIGRRLLLRKIQCPNCGTPFQVNDLGENSLGVNKKVENILPRNPSVEQSPSGDASTASTTSHSNTFKIFTEEEPVREAHPPRRTPFEMSDANIKLGVGRKRTSRLSSKREIFSNRDSLLDERTSRLPEQASPLQRLDRKPLRWKYLDQENDRMGIKKQLEEQLEAQLESQSTVQDKKYENSYNSCNTQGFKSLLPQPTFDIRNEQRELNSLTSDGGLKHSGEEQTEDMRFTLKNFMSNSRVPALPKRTDEKFSGDILHPEPAPQASPTYRHSSIYPITFLNTITEEDSEFSSNSIASQRNESISRHCINKTYSLEANQLEENGKNAGSVLRKSLRESHLNSQFNLNSLGQDRFNPLTDKENLRPGTLGFPSNNFLERPNLAVQSHSPYHKKPLDSIHDKENICNIESMPTHVADQPYKNDLKDERQLLLKKKELVKKISLNNLSQRRSLLPQMKTRSFSLGKCGSFVNASEENSSQSNNTRSSRIHLQDAEIKGGNKIILKNVCFVPSRDKNVFSPDDCHNKLHEDPNEIKIEKDRNLTVSDTTTKRVRPSKKNVIEKQDSGKNLKAFRSSRSATKGQEIRPEPCQKDTETKTANINSTTVSDGLGLNTYAHVRRSSRLVGVPKCKGSTSILSPSPEKIKLRKSKKSAQARKENGSKCLNLPEEDIFNPFRRDLIEKLLEDVGFPKPEYSSNYYVKKTNMPTGLRSMKLVDETFTILGELGKGTYGRVLKATSSDGKIVALKIEKPPRRWEYYIAKEIQSRIDPKFALAFMDIAAAYIYKNGSILQIEYAQYGTLVKLINTYKKSLGRPLEYGLILYFSLQLIDIVDHLHKCKIIHADLKPNNIVIQKLPNQNVAEPCLQLIDFGKSIDMSLFPEDFKFNYAFATESNTIIEMKENKPWTYQIDLYGLASLFYVLIFTEYMKVMKKNDKWQLQKLIPRNMRRELWYPIFDSLLNVNPATDLPFNFDLMRTALMDVFKTTSQTCSQQISFLGKILSKK